MKRLQRYGGSWLREPVNCVVGWCKGEDVEKLEEWAERGWTNAHARLAEVHDLKQENRRLRKLAETLREIANDGCGWAIERGEACRDKHPDNPDEWCWCCIAQEAIEKMEGSE
jgi:hypothetical protein